MPSPERRLWVSPTVIVLTGRSRPCRPLDLCFVWAEEEEAEDSTNSDRAPLEPPGRDSARASGFYLRLVVSHAHRLARKARGRYQDISPQPRTQPLGQRRSLWQRGGRRRWQRSWGRRRGCRRHGLGAHHSSNLVEAHVLGDGTISSSSPRLKPAAAPSRGRVAPQTLTASRRSADVNCWSSPLRQYQMVVAPQK